MRWTNFDIAPHTASAEITVTDDMETTYFCVFHPHMKRTIEIKG